MSIRTYEFKTTGDASIKEAWKDSVTGTLFIRSNDGDLVAVPSRLMQQFLKIVRKPPSR